MDEKEETKLIGTVVMVGTFTVEGETLTGCFVEATKGELMKSGARVLFREVTITPNEQ